MTMIIVEERDDTGKYKKITITWRERQKKRTLRSKTTMVGERE